MRTVSEVVSSRPLSDRGQFQDVSETMNRETKPSAGTVGPGVLIVNADDWGRDEKTTERTLECVLRGAVSSVSAMVFMEDSARAAAVAQESGIDAGLHLNLTTPFSMPGCPTKLAEHQQRLGRYLRPRGFGSVGFHAGL